MIYDIFLLFVGPLLVAAAIVKATRSSDGLEKVIKHFENYAVVAVIGLLLWYWNRELEQRGPTDPFAWIALVFFTALAALVGGLALANYFFGLRAIGKAFASAKFRGLKVWSLRILYSLFLLNLFFVLQDLGKLGAP
jgi:hypothetical protein